MTLKAKFHLSTACLILIVVIGMMSSLYNAEKKQVWTDIEDQQRADLAKLARVCEQSLIGSDELVLVNYVKTMSLSPKVSFAGFVSSDGSGWIYSRDKNFELTDPGSENVRTILGSHALLLRETRTAAAERVIEASMPVKDRGYVRLGYSQDVVNQIFQENVRAQLQRFLAVGCMAIFIGLILAQILGNALLKPVKLLMEAAQAIAKGQKGIEIPVTGKDELAKLTETFNEMSHELSKLDQLKDDFMSHVTHELRSPLTSIIATVELMSEMPAMSKDPKFKRSVDRLIYGSERLNRLVDNILDLTKLEAGKMQFDIMPVDISQLLVEMADFFEPRALEKGLEIRAKVSRQLPLVMADSERIRQVLSNLIYNAIKFTNRGEIVLWAKAADQKMLIGVQDTGVGIPADKLKKVFEKFECLQDTRNRVEKPLPGSGLGLNIVMNSVKAQGGTIWVESEVNKGSTFIFTLPLASEEDQKKYAEVHIDETALQRKQETDANERLVIKRPA